MSGTRQWSAGPHSTAPERTRFAWRRTALSATVTAVLATRLAVGERVSLLAGVLAALAVPLWLAAMLATQRRINQIDSGQFTEVGRHLPALALAVTGFAVLGIALVVLR
jgi:uncharacterized membrane protein YidH (DUF202 family)